MRPLKILIVGLITVLAVSVGYGAPPKIAKAPGIGKMVKPATVVIAPAHMEEVYSIEYLRTEVQRIYMSQVGVRELTGRNDGPAVEMYLKNAGARKGDPWCAAFVKWVYDKARVKNFMNAAAASAHRPKHLVYYGNKLISEPAPGDAFTLYYAKLGRIGHTGFYNKRLNSTVYQSVEGNTNGAGSREGNGVYVKYRSFNATHSISRWITSISQPDKWRPSSV